MNVLCVTNDCPTPVMSGGDVRVLGLLRAMASACSLHLLVSCDAKTAPSTGGRLAAEFGCTVELFPRNVSSVDVIAKATRWSRALLRGTPTWIDFYYNHELVDRAVGTMRRWDAVVLLEDYSGVYARRLAASRSCPIIADKHNVLGASVALGKQRRGSGLLTARALLEARLVRNYECRYLRATDAVVVTSEEEKGRLHRLYGRVADAVVPSAVDLLPRIAGKGDAGRVVWLGDLRYEPNVEGLARFVDSEWKWFGERGYRLDVIGQGSPPERCWLGEQDGVRLMGFVETLSPVLAEATTAIVPLWRGAGVKVKTLTLMGYGLPVVATPVALEGIVARDGVHALIGRSPAELASQLRRLFEDAALRARLGQAGRELVRRRYSWTNVGPTFVQVVENAVTSFREDGYRARIR